MSDRETFIHSYQSGHLLETIQAALPRDRIARAKLVSDLVSLHNEGNLDLVDVFDELTGESAPGHGSFLLRRVFEEALPDLEAPIAKLTRCVLRFYRKAGADMSADRILGAFQDFCAKSPERPQAVLAEVEADPETLADLLVPALVAGSKADPRNYVVEIIRLSRHANIGIRRRALSALGRLQGEQIIWGNEDVAKMIEHTVEVEDDDKVLASTIKPAFAFSIHDAANEARWIAAIFGALSKGGEITLHAASEIFGFQTSELSPELLKLLLEHLLQVRSANRGTLDNIDCGVADLLRGDNLEAGLRFLEELLRSHAEGVKLSCFDDAVLAIRDNPTLRGKVVTRWLLSGEVPLCEGLDLIFESPVGDPVEVEVDSSEVAGLDPVRFVFAARKAIGYLFLKPISATSFLLSLLRQSSDVEVRKHLETLLFDPLLLNFSGSVREYLVSRARTERGKVRRAIERALKDLDAYFEALRSIDAIPALHPSEEQRYAYRRHYSEIFSQSLRETEEESVLSLIAHKSVLLYGRKAIYQFWEGDGGNSRMETELRPLSVSVEAPRMITIDPNGLEFMILVFRNERISP